MDNTASSSALVSPLSSHLYSPSSSRNTAAISTPATRDWNSRQMTMLAALAQPPPPLPPQPKPFVGILRRNTGKTSRRPQVSPLSASKSHWSAPAHSVAGPSSTNRFLDDSSSSSQTHSRSSGSQSRDGSQQQHLRREATTGSDDTEDIASLHSHREWKLKERHSVVQPVFDDDSDFDDELDDLNQSTDSNESDSADDRPRTPSPGANSQSAYFESKDDDKPVRWSPIVQPRSSSIQRLDHVADQSGQSQPPPACDPSPRNKPSLQFAAASEQNLLRRNTSTSHSTRGPIRRKMSHRKPVPIYREDDDEVDLLPKITSSPSADSGIEMNLSACALPSPRAPTRPSLSMDASNTDHRSHSNQSEASDSSDSNASVQRAPVVGSISPRRIRRPISYRRQPTYDTSGRAIRRLHGSSSGASNEETIEEKPRSLESARPSLPCLSQLPQQQQQQQQQQRPLRRSRKACPSIDQIVFQTMADQGQQDHQEQTTLRRGSADRDQALQGNHLSLQRHAERKRQDPLLSERLALVGLQRPSARVNIPLTPPTDLRKARTSRDGEQKISISLGSSASRDSLGLFGGQDNGMDLFPEPPRRGSGGIKTSDYGARWI